MAGKKILKVVIAKAAIDGHWRGVQVVANALRDAGMEVVYAGMATADAAFQIALQEDADVIGLNIGASYEQVQELMRILKENHMDNILVIVGGTIPLVDIPRLKQIGVSGVFPPGSRLADIVKYVQENVHVRPSS
jgi:methylmalonyl-CoA mutase C-terminal domain/subunit